MPTPPVPRCLLLFTVLPLLPAQATPPPTPYPQLCTAATRADADALARLARPGQVLFADGFDAEDSLAAYFEIRGRAEGNAAIATGPAAVRAGTGSLRLTAPANDGQASGSSAQLWLGDAGHDVVHLRYWIRYAPDYDQGDLHHTGGSIAGVAGAGKWSGMGGAGQRPRGDDHFSTRVEGWRDWRRHDPPGYLLTYSYWMDMRRDRDGNYWGNLLGPEAGERRVPRRGAWQCVELRVAVNTPGEADGELAVWLDGDLYLHYRGFRWRSSADVRIKRIGLLTYVHAARRDNTAWFDDLVVATGYIGTGAPARDEPAAK
ncbi:MAG: hypothetical protein KF830_17125 [Planctomycetes bacterium]|nr:hypothetical protein [Planctomycetota bacterium]